MECECCLLEHDGTYGSGRFCSAQCARSFSTKHNRDEINRKVSETLRKIKPLVKCCICEMTFPPRGKQTCCSNSCAAKRRFQSLTYRSKINRHLKRVRKSWKTRSKLEPSFPERCVAQWLTEELKVEFEREWKFQRWFVDFVITQKKIALEVDGSQHDRRKEQDKEKDAALENSGWKVIRLRWKRLTKQSRQEMIEELSRNIA